MIETHFFLKIHLPISLKLPEEQIEQDSIISALDVAQGHANNVPKRVRTVNLNILITMVTPGFSLNL